MKILHALLNFLAGLVLVRFTVSKFAAWPESVAGFQDMASSIGIDPTFFRLTSGVIIGLAALSFFISCAIILFRKETNTQTVALLGINSLWALGAMAGALVSEFFLRSQPAWMLVSIAIALIVLAVVNLLSASKEISSLLIKFRGSD